MSPYKRSKTLVFAGFSFWHHGKHSGYDCIKQFVPYDLKIDFQRSVNFLHKIPGNGNIFFRIYLILFGDRPWWVELRIIFLLLVRKDIVLHFIYPENIYRYAGFFKGRKNKIICTFHQPPDFYKKSRKLFKSSRAIDKIIVMSNDMTGPVKKLYPFSKIIYIPHGVETKFFKPMENKKKERNVLIVGNWLRNFSFANSVIQQLITHDEDLSFNVVTNKNNHRLFTGHERLNLMSGIDDDHLLQLYQTSGVLFLPLNGFTANNALLEGAACGCRIVIATEQELDSCYIDERFVDFVPFEILLAAQKILDCLTYADSGRESLMVEFVRKSYDWEVIGKLTEAALRD